MVFIWEKKKFAFYSLQLCCLESTQSLPDWNSVVLGVLNNQNWCIPICNIGNWVKFVVRFLSYFIRFVPIRAAHVVVYEEQFLGSTVHSAVVEHTVVRNKRFETAYVVSCQPKYRVTSKAGSNSTNSVVVYIRFLSNFVDGVYIILHSASPVATNGFVPRYTVPWHTTSVGGNHNIALRCHQLEIPTERIKLRERRLRSTLSVE